MSQPFENLTDTDVRNALIFLDIDGTLVSDNEDAPSKSVLKKIKELQKNNVIWLCSNSFNIARNETIRSLTGLPLIKGYRKPSKKILDQVTPEDLHDPSQPAPRPIVVIGDKVLTDGLFAKHIGGTFIKVKRKLGRDRLRIKLYNLIDDIAYFFLKKLF